jgi:hypothetical protein
LANAGWQLGRKQTWYSRPGRLGPTRVGRRGSCRAGRSRKARNGERGGADGRARPQRPRRAAGCAFIPPCRARLARRPLPRGPAPHAPPVAACPAESASDTVVLGLCDDPDLLIQGDLFVCRLDFSLGEGIVDRHQQVGATGAAGPPCIGGGCARSGGALMAPFPRGGGG